MLSWEDCFAPSRHQQLVQNVDVDFGGLGRRNCTLCSFGRTVLSALKAPKVCAECRLVNFGCLWRNCILCSLGMTVRRM